MPELFGAGGSDMKKRVVLVAATTGYQTRAFGEAAAKLDVELMLATDRCHILDDPWGDHAIPIRFEDPHGAAEQIPPCDALLAVADRPTLVAALAGERLQLPYHPFGAVSLCHNKYLMRKKFQDAGLPVPESRLISLEHLPDEYPEFPCVLKPLGLSASRGVIRANNEQEFREAFLRIRAILQGSDVARFRESENRFLQVETFIPGREFALEGLMTKGVLTRLALFDKPDPLDGPFFEETIYLTPSRESKEVQKAITSTVQKAVHALGLWHGPIHAEMRVNENGVFMLEVAARPIGGLCAKALRFTNRISLEELLIRHALGEDVRGIQREPYASGVMMIPIPHGGVYQDVTGVADAQKVPGMDSVLITAKPGQTLIPLPEGASYLGFLFARGITAGEVDRTLRQAHACLEFTIQPILPVLQSTA